MTSSKPSETVEGKGGAMEELIRAEGEAVAQYKETAQLARERVASVQHDGAPPDEAAAKLSWVACMLLSTSEEALRTKHALMKAHAQHAHDSAARAELLERSFGVELEQLKAERDALRASLEQATRRQNKAGIEAKQRQAREASRAQALEAQVAQLQQQLKAGEASWVEKQRAEQEGTAAAAQRERNLQTAIVKMQRDLDRMEKTIRHHEGLQKAGGTSNEVVLKQRCEELQQQCQTGVELIQKLKMQVQQQHQQLTLIAAERRSMTYDGLGTPRQLAFSNQQPSTAATPAFPVSTPTSAVPSIPNPPSTMSMPAHSVDAVAELNRSEARHRVEIAVVTRELDLMQRESNALRHHAKEGHSQARTASQALMAAATRARDLERRLQKYEEPGHQARREGEEVDASLLSMLVRERDEAEEAVAWSKERVAQAELKADDAVARLHQTQRQSHGAVALLRTALGESERRQRVLEAMLQERGVETPFKWAARQDSTRDSQLVKQAMTEPQALQQQAERRGVATTTACAPSKENDATSARAVLQPRGGAAVAHDAAGQSQDASEVSQDAASTSTDPRAVRDGADTPLPNACSRQASPSHGDCTSSGKVSRRCSRKDLTGPGSSVAFAPHPLSHQATSCSDFRHYEYKNDLANCRENASETSSLASCSTSRSASSLTYQRRRSPTADRRSPTQDKLRNSAPPGGEVGELHALRGLNRVRASLLDTLRTERLKLERERELLKAPGRRDSLK
ncbi:hypothetical protein AB1Y20_018700 [Prymnesium parvum]|uniref:Uncharacterized protein n=1 Tax=Prymnesium parvum TaxID=97485 RepID=A0AB34JPH5_PRYPA